MLYSSIIGLIGNAAFYGVAYFTQEDTTMGRVLADAVLMRDVILIALCGAIGQIFIYLTISLHDCYKLSIMTTTRKCMTVIISAFYFNHEFT